MFYEVLLQVSLGFKEDEKDRQGAKCQRGVQNAVFNISRSPPPPPKPALVPPSRIYCDINVCSAKAFNESHNEKLSQGAKCQRGTQSAVFNISRISAPKPALVPLNRLYHHIDRCRIKVRGKSHYDSKRMRRVGRAPNVRGDVQIMFSIFHDLQPPSQLFCQHSVYTVNVLYKGTSRQRSGNFPLQKPRWEKTKLTIGYLYHENIS